MAEKHNPAHATHHESADSELAKIMGDNSLAGQYVFTREAATPSKRVTVTEVPPAFAAALDAEWEYVKRDQVVPVIVFPTAKDAAFHLAYAKAWGGSKPEGEKVTVKKGPARKDEPEGTLRLIMEPFNPNAPKRGRKPSTATA